MLVKLTNHFTNPPCHSLSARVSYCFLQPARRAYLSAEAVHTHPGNNLIRSIKNTFHAKGAPLNRVYRPVSHPCKSAGSYAHTLCVSAQCSVHPLLLQCCIVIRAHLVQYVQTVSLLHDTRLVVRFLAAFFCCQTLYLHENVQGVEVSLSWAQGTFSKEKFSSPIAILNGWCHEITTNLGNICLHLLVVLPDLGARMSRSLCSHPCLASYVLQQKWTPGNFFLEARERRYSFFLFGSRGRKRLLTSDPVEIR